MFKLLQKFRPLNYEHFQFQSGFWELLSKSKVLLFFEVLSSHMEPLLDYEFLGKMRYIDKLKGNI